MFKKIVEFFLGTAPQDSKEDKAKVEAVIKQAKNTIKRAATDKVVAKNAAKKTATKKAVAKKPAAKKTTKKKVN